MLQLNVLLQRAFRTIETFAKGHFAFILLLDLLGRSSSPPISVLFRILLLLHQNCPLGVSRFRSILSRKFIQDLMYSVLQLLYNISQPILLDLQIIAYRKYSFELFVELVKVGVGGKFTFV